MAVITISREYGSRGEEIGKLVAKALSYSYFDKEILTDVARAANISKEQVSRYDEKEEYGLRGFLKKLFLPDPSRYVELPYHYYLPETLMDDPLYSMEKTRKKQREPILDANEAAAFFGKVIEKLWNRGNVVIIGRGGQKILSKRPNTVHVRFIGLTEDRRKTVMHQENLTAEKAAKKIEKLDKQRFHHFRNYFNDDWSNPELYHLVINTSFVANEQAVQAILAIVRQTNA
jgi:cytidylate kinase